MNTLGIKESEVKALNKKGVLTREQLRRLFPRKYADYTSLSTLSPFLNSCEVALKVKLIKSSTTYQNNQYITKATAVQDDNYINLVWFHNFWISKILSPLLQKEVLLIGKITYNEAYKNYNMVNAQITEYDPNLLCVQTVYSSIKGIKDDVLRSAIDSCLLEEETDYLPKDIVSQNGLIGLNDSLRLIHHPNTLEDVKNAQMRILFDDLLYFAIRLEEENEFAPKGTIYQANFTKCADRYINSLPYALTKSQSDVIYKLRQKMKDSRRINALIQGDVGCGKTTVAFATMITMAENGYQSVLLTPTVALGSQHYLELKEVAEPMGLNVCFYGGTLTQKEKKDMKKKIKEGYYSLIVGTQGVVNIEFDKLALVIADEEHKYGVEQRDKLLKDGVHMITMSATPIPRSIATTIYGTSKDVYVINELPSNRKPIKTFHFDNEDLALKGVAYELSQGHQAYVVCPLVNESENEKFKDISDVKRVTELYKNTFKDKVVATVTGSMKKSELEAVLTEFKKGNIHILVATSVIEVGVSVPNASVIVLYNAERFGLAELHQLRGRVGRGSIPSKCVLLSEDKENVRIKKMLETTDGFEIAKADLENRGVGDLLGTEQSGRNKFIELALKYPNKFEYVKRVAHDMITTCDYQTFLKEYEERTGMINGSTD